ncbi:MAG: hypothetical protein JEZ08_08605 [Clostridiales bacterium]|nr:hypothetical protein [Clostridiales bacterium]
MISKPKFTEFKKQECLSNKTKDSLFAMGKYIRKLKKEAHSLGVKQDGPVFTIYYEEPENPKDFEYEVFLPINQKITGITKSIGDEFCASIRINGSIKQFKTAHNTLTDFIKNNNHEAVGHLIVVYVKGPLLGFLAFIPTMVTDFYFPIKE